MEEAQRKDLRKTAKRLLKVSKEHPEWYTKADVKYAKMIKRQTKKTVDTTKTGTLDKK